MITGRFAPSPSGPLHLGNLACCILAYLSARSAGGEFLLRIEDLDTQRCRPEYAEDAIRVLRRFGFDWDGEVLWQSRRSAIYEEALQKLDTYPCFCTRAELLASSAPNLGDTQTVYPGTCRSLTAQAIAEKKKVRRPALRLRVPDEEISFTDGLQGICTENLARDCGDFILRRSDGLYGYQLAVVVDDGLSSVTQVVRGRDILSATPRQIYLTRLLGYEPPSYWHIPLLLSPDGRRLAKRDHDLGLENLLTKFSPQQILGHLSYAYGIVPSPRPISLADLVPRFSWSCVPRNDVRLGAQLLE